MIAYKKTTTIEQLLTNCKHLALSKTREHVKSMSSPCRPCTLCGNHAKHNKLMVPCVSQIMGKNKTLPLNQKLTCANHRIYVATCVICHKQQVVQTKNKFSMRWSSHRSNWNRLNCEFDENNKDKVALLGHFSESHGDVSKPPMPTEGFVFRYCFNSQNVTPWWTTRPNSYYNNYHRVCSLRCLKAKAFVWEQWTCVVSTKEKLTKHDRLWVLSAPHNHHGAVALSVGLTYVSYSAV